MKTVFLSRSKTTRYAVILFLPILFLFHPWTAFSEETLEDALKPDQELEEELKYLKAETYVITPSRIPQRIEKAPGSIYVVTDKQIRQMGARYLSDVIETVPGWSLFPMPIYGTQILARGVGGGPSSTEILFMVNSQVVNNPLDGGGKFYLNLDLDNVKQIEFVTGAGSALYGSGAMQGIVNIITKEGEDVDGLQLTGRGGSYNTWETNALFGKTIEGFEVAAYVDYLDTDGFHGHVDQDQQSVLDQRWGTHASLAPGNMKGGADQWDGQLTMKYKGLKFDGKYIGRKWEPLFGVGRVILDNMSKMEDQQYYLNLSYDATLMEGLDLLVKIYRNQYSRNGTAQNYPKDSLIGTPTGPTILSDNKFTEYGHKSRRTGAEAQTTYEIWDANTIVGGITFEQMEEYDNSIKGNWLNVREGVIIPLPSVQDWPDSMIMPDKKREFWAAYVEDLWDITDDLRLTIGGRYDHYSDFGGQFSPRVGINWDFAQNYYAKCLYSRAFRAPTFYELYSVNSGDPDLKPATKDDYQLSFGVRFPPSFSAEVTGYYFKGEDPINLEHVWIGTQTYWQYVNLDKENGKGVELRMKYDFGRGTYLSMNYTYQNLELWDAYGIPTAAYRTPKQIGTLTANIRLNQYLNLNAYLLYRGDWTRLEDDTRDDPGDYAIVNATLTARNFLKDLKGLEVRAAVKNLLNKDYVSPQNSIYLPDDMPMPGINFFLELRYTF